MIRPFAVRNIDHIVLRVSDISASKAFYCDLLGCVEERSLTELGLYQLRAGQQLIDLVPLGTALGGDGDLLREHRNQDHFCLIVEPFDEQVLRSYFAENGIEVSQIAQRYGAGGQGPSFYIVDPDGNSVEVKALTA